jgi:hypothetical protein
MFHTLSKQCSTYGASMSELLLCYQRKKIEIPKIEIARQACSWDKDSISFTASTETTNRDKD